MKFLLALDCSTARGGVALGLRASDEPPVDFWHKAFQAGRGRGGELFTALREGLQIVRDTDGSSLEGILVGLGPGSYSGVRQSIAAAVGLSAATGAWLRGVPSALGLDERRGSFQAVGDARRGAYYYTAVCEGRCTAGPELLENRAALEARLAENPDCLIYVVETALPDGLLPEAEVRLPDVRNLLHASEETHRPPPLEPIYLRPVSITLPKTP